VKFDPKINIVNTAKTKPTESIMNIFIDQCEFGAV